jgi:HJR/Mrr/RecB family endonuclease
MHITYEQAVANSLSDLGWRIRPVYVNNEDRASLMAEMRDERILIHCRRYALCVGLLAIEIAQQRQAASGATNVVIVSDGKFTDRARQLAASRSVMLLHHNRLMRLEERLFGTDAWRQIPPRTVQSEGTAAISLGPPAAVPNAA